MKKKKNQQKYVKYIRTKPSKKKRNLRNRQKSPKLVNPGYDDIMAETIKEFVFTILKNIKYDS